MHKLDENAGESMKIDLTELRQSLLEYAGAAWGAGIPGAAAEMAAIESASLDDLILIAERLGLTI